MLPYLFSKIWSNQSAAAPASTRGEQLVYLQKSLMNMDELLDGSIDGKHGWVRKWVLFNLSDDDVEGAVFGHSGGVRVEMVALGANESIVAHAVPFVKKRCMFSAPESMVLLLQRSGFFVLGLFFTNDEFASSEMNADAARNRMEHVSTIIILNLS